MQTILGSGGAIGIELAKALHEYTNEIRLVSRNPKRVNDTDELMSADLLNPAAVEKAVIGSAIVYVTVGFPYSVKEWRKTWPPFIDSVIKACIKHKSKMVFFDNIYMYDANSINGMTEETPINPPSEKGKIRTEVVNRILQKVESGELNALIARSADFYGPSIKNTSMMTELILNNLYAGKKANWLASDKFKHSFTYTPDAAKATAILGNTVSAYNQVWHLPTAPNPLTGKELIELAAKEMGVKPKTQIATKFLVRIMGLFMPIMKEIVEMMYQYDRDYVFDSTKFEKEFKFHPTSYEQGIRNIIAIDYPKK